MYTVKLNLPLSSSLFKQRCQKLTLSWYVKTSLHPLSQAGKSGLGHLPESHQMQHLLLHHREQGCTGSSQTRCLWMSKTCLNEQDGRENQSKAKLLPLEYLDHDQGRHSPAELPSPGSAPGCSLGLQGHHHGPLWVTVPARSWHFQRDRPANSSARTKSPLGLEVSHSEASHQL